VIFLIFKRVKMSSVRDVLANRAHLNGVGHALPVSIITLAANGDVPLPAFTPGRNAIHLTVPTVARSYTLTEAAMLASYDLKLGEGFIFWIQNNSAGANTVTLVAGGGVNVTSGAGTFTIAQNTTRQFIIVRTGAATHTLYTTGSATH
jgi:hypothetical protein